MEEKIISGLIGGLISILFYPYVKYLFLRIFNSERVDIFLDNQRKEGNYTVQNLRVKNEAWSTIRSMSIRVSVNNDPDDLSRNDDIITFCHSTKIDDGLLSWSKNLNGKNIPEMDVYQGDSPDINFIRIHEINGEKVLEIASENGFGSCETTSRALLKASRNYIFDFVLTADNISPIYGRIKFDPQDSSKPFVLLRSRIDWAKTYNIFATI